MQTPAPTCPLAKATRDAMIASTLAALPHAADASPAEVESLREAARAALLSLRPRDPIEAGLAAQAIAAHHAAMACFRAAARPETPDAIVLRCQGRAVAFSHLFASALRRLQVLQAQPALYAMPAGQAAVAPAAGAWAAASPAPGSTPAPRPPATSRPAPDAAPRAQPETAAPARPLDPRQARLLDEMAARAMTALPRPLAAAQRVA